MAEKLSSEGEDETRAAKEARRRRWFRRYTQELSIAVVFLGAIFAADHSAGSEPPATEAAAFFVGVAIATLAAWFMLHLRRFRSLDEFERVIELRSISLAGGGVVLFAASWGVAEIILGVPDFPLAMLAPMFSIFYVLARFRIASDFR